MGERSSGPSNLRAGAEAVRSQGEHDHNVDLYTDLVEQQGREDLRADLALAHSNRGGVRAFKGALDGAITDFDLALGIYSELVAREGRKELRNDLAMAHSNRGSARAFKGALDGAISDFDRAVDIYTELVEREGQKELRDDLASALLNRAIGRAQRNTPDAAVADAKAGITLWRALLDEGRSDLRPAFVRNAAIATEVHVAAGLTREGAALAADGLSAIEQSLVSPESRTALLAREAEVFLKRIAPHTAALALDPTRLKRVAAAVARLALVTAPPESP